MTPWNHTINRDIITLRYFLIFKLLILIAPWIGGQAVTVIKASEISLPLLALWTLRRPCRQINMSHETRTILCTNVYFVENYEENITGYKLSSNKQVLCFFFCYHDKLNETIHASATKIVEKVAEFWNGAHLPLARLYKKVTGLFEKCKSIKKNTERQTETQEKVKR